MLTLNSKYDYECTDTFYDHKCSNHKNSPYIRHWHLSFVYKEHLK